MTASTGKETVPPISTVDTNGFARPLSSERRLPGPGSRRLAPAELLARLAHPLASAVHIVQNIFQLDRAHLVFGSALFFGRGRNPFELFPEAFRELVGIGEECALGGGGGAKLRAQRLGDMGTGDSFQ